MKKYLRVHSWRRRLNLLLHRWHRRIGVTASLFLVWMAVSGWLLNHTANFDLTHRMLTSDFIATHYGIRSEIPQSAFVAGGHRLVAGDDATVLDGRKVALVLSHPRGMILQNGILFVAEPMQLILLDANGELIDKVSAPMAIEKIGSGCGGAVIANDEKQLATRDGAAFVDCGDSVQWAREERLTDEQRTQTMPLLRSGISLERLLLDLHSGRFFGTWGPYFVDALGLGLVALALSGIWLFMRHSAQRRAHQSH